MTPPETPATAPDAAGDATPAVSSRLATLNRRADFLRAARAARVARPGFILQMHNRADGEAEGIRVGFTCSKKVGNAVARNRAKRRLREIARIVLPRAGRDGCDYVLIGRQGATATLPFGQLVRDLEGAVAKVHAPRPDPSR
ncbi:ribonuclease P protein component [Sulfitobacter sp. D35]|uniref:ribonuclease P protein component n=1 Tax=Sulfitobacter sp. D35 TaxID=3083252 RepID=UPI00296ED047|nr:ribonuclease P protein component [Sulfitobacter sp. D35]MDW4500475.1 ribonuclease P protein component [Sulfitobacter sp. D35]